MTMTDWQIPGAEGEVIRGTTHLPEGSLRGVVIIAHGFKGYKDYGMFPRIASHLAAHGFIAHRFNFSHSGMGANIDSFERPDLFERDTWNKQVHDLRATAEAIENNIIAGRDLPLIMFGHSRGGASTLLTVGRHAADDPQFQRLAGIVTAAAPSSTCNLHAAQIDALRRDGFIESPSSRTGQALRIARNWLDEQTSDPAAHDLLTLVANIQRAILIIHGEDDPTVSVACAEELAAHAVSSSSVQVERIAHANHVFNTPNPFPDDAAPGPELAHLLDTLVQFSSRACVQLH